MPPDSSDPRWLVTLTLEAFADTVMPGEKRSPDDRAIAGVATGGGAVTAGALDLLRTDEGGLAGALDSLAEALNVHAASYAGDRGLALDPAVPEFVSLAYDDRAALILSLTLPEHSEHELWVALVMFCNMAFDTAAQTNLAGAMAGGHPGLTAMGFATADDDGLWRFPEYSYGRALARLHPSTTASGSPA